MTDLPTQSDSDVPAREPVDPAQQTPSTFQTTNVRHPAGAEPPPEDGDEDAAADS